MSWPLNGAAHILCYRKYLHDFIRLGVTLVVYWAELDRNMLDVRSSHANVNAFEVEKQVNGLCEGLKHAIYSMR